MMAGNWCRTLVWGGMGLLVVLSSGCRFAGGGSMPSASGLEGERATVAFTGECDDNALQTLALQLQYNEHGTGEFADVRFHAEAGGPCFGALGDKGEYVGGFTGEYCPQPYGQYQHEPNAGCGEVVIEVVDGGEGTNAPLPDSVWFVLNGGTFDGYSNAGAVQGNIQFIESK